MELIKKLKNIKSKDLNKKVFVGFDGFDDKIQKVVKSESNGDVEYFRTIDEYGMAVKKAAGKSSQFQLRTQVQKLGGNAPIMANALGSMGIKNSLMASLGFPEIRPVFKDLHPLVSPVSVCDPGETNALEFNDGKVMLSEMTSFNEFNWCSLLINPGLERILEELNSSDLVALVDWANLIHCSDIWEGIYKDILPVMKEHKKFFFDIADPSRSSKEELEEVLEIMASYSSYGDVYLGINENETFLLYEKIFKKSSAEISLEEAGREIYKLLNINGLLIHPIDRSLMITSEEIIEEKGRVVPEPKISTGGGDNFNAGFCLGLLLGFSPRESMITGMATSGFYVKYGKSPSVGEIAGYLEE